MASTKAAAAGTHSQSAPSRRTPERLASQTDPIAAARTSHASGVCQLRKWSSRWTFALRLQRELPSADVCWPIASCAIGPSSFR